MTRHTHESCRSGGRRFTRRQFLKLAAVGLLVGCRGVQEGPVGSDVAPTARAVDTQAPSPTETPVPSATAAPSATVTTASLLSATEEPSATPAVAASATSEPTLTPIPEPTVTRGPTSTSAEEPTAKPPATSTPIPEPTERPTATPAPTDTTAPTLTPQSPSGTDEATPTSGLSRVVHTHASVWNGKNLAPAAVRQMLDTSMVQLTGQASAREAWASLFQPHERIAIKVNVIQGSSYYTHPVLVGAMTDSLQEAGIAAEQLVVFDRSAGELRGAGYTINKDGSGVRCYGTERGYTAGWELMGIDIKLSDILLDCDALINAPVLKQHGISGISFALKNHYGTFNIPGQFHAPRIGRALAELNALAPIRDRTRLVVGDALTIVKSGWRSAITGDSILVSTDPLAIDVMGLEVYASAMKAEGRNVGSAVSLSKPWLEAAAELGVGTNDLTEVEVMEVLLG